MDNTQQPPTVLSLCSGYGGLEIGLRRAIGELKVLTHVEIEAYAVANLVAKMEQGFMAPAPIWTDLKTLPVEPFRNRVDILTGGYPCQPFSHAGKRQGSEDSRHIWPDIRRLVREIRPRLCFFENVEGHITLGLSTVISDLEEDGYKTTWGIFSASEIGQIHIRKRVFLCANANNKRFQWWANVSKNTQREAWKPERFRRKQQFERLVQFEIQNGVPTKSATRVHDGDKRRVDRLRLLGNGVVPQTAEKAFRVLINRFKNGEVQ